jgi:amidase
VPDRGDKATAVHPCRRKTAGAVILGKTNVPVDYRRYQVKGDIYPEGKNPYGLEYSPGGSTGGGAAAVAAGMTALELGADGGGSLRVPAHFCGVFCLKPTDKTIPRYGMVPPPRRGFLVSLVQAGPLGRSIDDLELLWEIIRGPEPSDFEIHRSTGIHRQAIRSINSASPGPMGSSRTSRAPRRASSSLHWRLGSSARGLTSRRQRLRFILAPTRCSSSCLGALVGQDMPWPVRKIFPVLAARGLLRGQPHVVKLLRRRAQDEHARLRGCPRHQACVGRGDGALLR